MRELRRAIDSTTFERIALANEKLATVSRVLPDGAVDTFKDSYVIEFLDLPAGHSEGDLRRGLVRRLWNFLRELGRDFTFIGEEYPIQVGNRDGFIDLLFFHRELNCLVAIELKITEFQPEHIGQLNFYLEALDRDVKKALLPSIHSKETASLAFIMKGQNDRFLIKREFFVQQFGVLSLDNYRTAPGRRII